MFGATDVDVPLHALIAANPMAKTADESSLRARMIMCSYV